MKLVTLFDSEVKMLRLCYSSSILSTPLFIISGVLAYISFYSGLIVFGILTSFCSAAMLSLSYQCSCTFKRTLKNAEDKTEHIMLEDFEKKALEKKYKNRKQ